MALQPAWHGKWPENTSSHLMPKGWFLSLIFFSFFSWALSSGELCSFQYVEAQRVKKNLKYESAEP